MAYAPYFDTSTTCYAHALQYEHLCAIYNCGAFACSDHFAERPAHIVNHRPEWILRGEDEPGQPTPQYLPFGCQPAGCPQQAADIGNPEFRQFRIDAVAENLEAADDAGFGYPGIFLDDVNLDLNRCDPSASPHHNPKSESPGWSSGRRPSGQKNLRSVSLIGRSLMLA